MSEMRLVIVGAGGRMGRNLIRAVHETAGCVVAGAVEQAGSELIGRDAGDLAGLGPIGVAVSDEPLALFAKADGVLDFTAPNASLGFAEIAAVLGIADAVHRLGRAAVAARVVDDDAVARGKVRHLAGEDLETFIRQCAATNGIDTTRPFPFTLDGRVSDLEIHVINGECPMRPGGRLTSDQAPWRWTADHAPNAQVVGFFASDSVGNMTHPGTSIHAHAIVRAKGRDVTGHIERIAMARGSVLKLPVVR